MFIAEFQEVGRDLFTRGLVSSHGGNMSMRFGDRLLITRRGAKLGHLTELDLIETGIERNDRATPTASSELAVHRAIYQSTQAHAVLHAHPPYALALSFLVDELVPIDAEGRDLLEQVPIIGTEVIARVRDVLEEVVASLETHKVVIVRGHGTFARGQLLDEAHRWTSLLEESCKIASIVRFMGGSGKMPGKSKVSRSASAILRA